MLDKCHNRPQAGAQNPRSVGWRIGRKRCTFAQANHSHIRSTTMTENPFPRQLDGLDILSITQLVLSERESRDNGWWSRMADCFHPDARIRLSWIDGDTDAFVKGSIDMARRGMKARHRVGPPVVRLNGERAVASLPAIIDIPAEIGGIEAQLSSYARFLYRSNSGMAAGALLSSIPSICAMSWLRPSPAT